MGNERDEKGMNEEEIDAEGMDGEENGGQILVRFIVRRSMRRECHPPFHSQAIP